MGLLLSLEGSTDAQTWQGWASPRAWRVQNGCCGLITVMLGAPLSLSESVSQTVQVTGLWHGLKMSSVLDTGGMEGNPVHVLTSPMLALSWHLHLTSPLEI